MGKNESELREIAMHASAIIADLERSRAELEKARSTLDAYSRSFSDVASDTGLVGKTDLLVSNQLLNSHRIVAEGADALEKITPLHGAITEVLNVAKAAYEDLPSSTVSLRTRASLQAGIPCYVSGFGAVTSFSMLPHVESVLSAKREAAAATVLGVVSGAFGAGAGVIAEAKVEIKPLVSLIEDPNHGRPGGGPSKVAPPPAIVPIGSGSGSTGSGSTGSGSNSSFPISSPSSPGISTAPDLGHNWSDPLTPTAPVGAGGGNGPTVPSAPHVPGNPGGGTGPTIIGGGSGGSGGSGGIGTGGGYNSGTGTSIDGSGSGTIAAGLGIGGAAALGLGGASRFGSGGLGGAAGLGSSSAGGTGIGAGFGAGSSGLLGGGAGAAGSFSGGGGAASAGGIGARSGGLAAGSGSGTLAGNGTGRLGASGTGTGSAGTSGASGASAAGGRNGGMMGGGGAGGGAGSKEKAKRRLGYTAPRVDSEDSPIRHRAVGGAGSREDFPELDEQ